MGIMTMFNLVESVSLISFIVGIVIFVCNVSVCIVSSYDENTSINIHYRPLGVTCILRLRKQLGAFFCGAIVSLIASSSSAVASPVIDLSAIPLSL